MIATLLAMLFAGAALFAAGAIADSWRNYGGRFAELRDQLRTVEESRTVRYAWRQTSAVRPSALVYSLDFKAKAEGLPFHPELRPELSAAA